MRELIICTNSEIARPSHTINKWFVLLLLSVQEHMCDIARMDCSAILTLFETRAQDLFLDLSGKMRYIVVF